MNEKVKPVVEEFSTWLKDIFSDDYTALVLYGSAVGNNYCENRSDINLLIILENNNTDKLLKLGSSVKNLIRNHRISTVTMTRNEFVSSADVFPLEYSDILENHTLIYGNSEILDITVSMENLRLQLEEKLRGAVSDIRNMLIAAEGNEKNLGKLILNWSSLGGVLLRGLLRLKGINVTNLDSKTISSEVEKIYKVSLEVFSVLSRLRLDNVANTHAAATLVDALLDTLSSLVNEVDLIKGNVS